MTLKEFFENNPKCALAFSGGTDSSLLLWAAGHYGADVTAYFAKTPFQPQFELDDAERLASLLGAKLKIVSPEPLASEDICRNDENRCYYCKREIFTRIFAEAKADGYTLVIDGTNASDDVSDRPGIRALREMGVRSPLRECGITKAEVRSRSAQAGLFTGEKPSYACLATRIPTGARITQADLSRVERGEIELHKLGFYDFRLRLRQGAALLQVKSAQMPLALQKRGEILRCLKGDFTQVYLDFVDRDSAD